MNDLLNRLIILSKAELQLVGIFFRTQFPSLGSLTKKKLEIEKTKTTFYYIGFKSCILGGLSFY